MTDTGKPRLSFSQEYSVYQPRSQAAYPVLEGDWERIKRMLRETVPIRNWFQVTASICAGVSVSALFTLIAFSASKDVPFSAKLISWVGLIAGAVLSIGLFFLDSERKDLVQRSTESVIREMESLEKGFEKSVNATAVVEAPPALRATQGDITARAETQ